MTAGCWELQARGWSCAGRARTVSKLKVRGDVILAPTRLEPCQSLTCVGMRGRARGLGSKHR